MNKLAENLRIIWAITAKDIVDAIKNKTTLVAMLSVLFMIVFYRLLPILTSSEVPALLVYDAGDSTLVAALENSDAVDVYTYPSQEKMQDYLANGEVPELGLVIPANFDQVIAAGSIPELQGYVLHWVSKADAAELQDYVEALIAELTGSSVQIHLDGNIVYPPPDGGSGVMTGMGIVFAVIMVGISMIPNLMLEEKQTRTIDALLVSPAGPVHVTVAKALTGLFYGLSSAAVALALNSVLIIHWLLVILTAILGTLLAVALGLVLGTLIETRQQLMLYAWILIAPLMLPPFLSLMEDLLPAWLIAVFHWIPSVAMFRLLLVSFSNQAEFGLYGSRLALLLASAVLVLAVVAWLVRRMDR
ncbi:MAG: ABC transporter permease [Thermoflexales bacterium]|nr:ABC transporter permease [Thermoflexales bacterium]